MRTAAVLLASLAPLAALALPAGSPADALWRRAASSVTGDGAAQNGKNFDYVVVGCGLAGMVNAVRLAEDGASVLCIEAGQDTRKDPDVTNVAKYGSVTARDDLNFKYKTVEQPQANGRQLQISAGRGLGGSTSINGAAWARGHSGQLDALQELGSEGWSWSEWLEYAKKSENFSAPDDSQAAAGAAWDPSVHGEAGPVSISFPESMYRGEPPRKFVNAVTGTLGVKLVNDLGNGEQPAVAWTPNTIQPYSGDDQTRVSSATAYLSPIEYGRANLVVLTGYRAAAIAWADAGDVKRARSVSFLQAAGDEPFSVNVSKEVVVAAGAIRTPLFLEASGVGEASVLSKIGVTQQIDLPVGRNLQEQTMNSVGGNSAGDADGSGPSGTIAFLGIDALFSNASDVRANVESQLDGWAQQVVDAGAHSSKAGLLKQYNKLVSGIWDQGWGVYELFSDIGYPTPFGIDTWGLLPFSRGTVHSTSASPFADPELNPRYFSVPLDMDVQVAGLRAARRVLQAMGLDEQVPGFDTIPDGSNHGRYSRWEDWIRDGFASVAHPLGTAQMAPREDGGVVDAQLKVYGSSNLRVVDASVLPMQQSTHLSSILYGVAERAADLIKAANN